MATVSVLNTDAGVSAKTLVTAEGTHTIDGLHTFDRDPNAPFAVSSGSAVVSNLDADKLDGQEGTYYTNATNLASGTVPAARLPAATYCIVYNSATQSIPNTTETVVTFDSETADPSGLHSTASNTDRVTVAADGLYMIHGRVWWAANATGQRQIRIAVGGVDQVISNIIGNATYEQHNHITSVLSLTAGQYISLRVYQDSGGALTIGHALTRSAQSELRVVRLT